MQLLEQYKSEIIDEIRKVDEAEFGKAIDLLLEAYRHDRQVFIAGNGGSAGTANHFVCDFGKNAVPWDRRRFRIHSLCDNVEVITALGNDIAFDQIFAFQMGNAVRPGDVLIVISASGNSPDIVNACTWAKAHDVKVIALGGFGGGKMADYADVKLVTDMRSYERIEDLHLMILHMVVCWFKANADRLEG
ncbi:MAG: SIS domain-containing protein [Clostridia bacterium]|nr:SIS domain-containing protein [Clostridia bacterium]